MKFIASDFDGTLLNEKGMISERNIKAINKARSKGIQFAAATGRSYDAAIKPLKHAGINCPIIALNGATIYDENHHLIDSIPMDRETCKKILAVSQDAHLYIEFFTSDGIYSSSREQFAEVLEDIMKSANPDVTREEVETQVNQRFQNEKIQFIDDYRKLINHNDIQIFKMLCSSLNPDNLEMVYEQLKNESDIAITSSGHMNLEFNHPNAQKGMALERLAKQMNISMEDVMALGDNLNDKSMLERAGRGVAMENAAEEILSLCNYKTKTNEEDGVAYAIEEMLEEMKQGNEPAPEKF
ncbi:Cof-type HAD-IIB family hydrolase [Virgibacillus sp. MSP4-1]|uniref:Cof-type HAD-IIB family hydrolase n=1 Tax=Virgibacillus sp. MSP4-1 TaxID=2700081 RepID=UPI0003A5AEF2|nr:Cof-type HAD-IIB family hydrolase [Virgibacillus sp. MSP4-1]QHS24246.1 Cof-type HAD-IIB family hydrolase [Virgibacillus sp. MSP4-1]